MYKVIVLSALILFSVGEVFAASKPSGLEFPPAPTGNPRSDCEQSLKDWNFPQEVVVGRNNEYIFLAIDRYGGEREYADYRGTMCRVKDMYEMWSLYELFADMDNIAFTDDGKYFVNGMGNVPCESEEDIERISKVGVLVFYRNGEQIKSYQPEEILPGWKEICADSKTLDWQSWSYSFKKGISENNKTFTLKTKDDTTHYFNIETGNKIDSPIE